MDGPWHGCAAWGRTRASRGSGGDGMERPGDGAPAGRRQGQDVWDWAAVFFGGSGRGNSKRSELPCDKPCYYSVYKTTGNKQDKWQNI